LGACESLNLAADDKLGRLRKLDSDVFFVQTREFAIDHKGVLRLVSLKAGLPWASVNSVGGAGNLSAALLLRVALALLLRLLGLQD
jgi:hypothetical protein